MTSFLVISLLKNSAKNTFNLKLDIIKFILSFRKIYGTFIFKNIENVGRKR